MAEEMTRLHIFAHQAAWKRILGMAAKTLHPLHLKKRLTIVDVSAVRQQAATFGATVPTLATLRRA